MKTPEEILKNHLNMDRLTPLQWDGIRRSMEEYVKQYILSNKEANEFIIDIANLLQMDTDGIGYDDLQYSIDDFKEAIRHYVLSLLPSDEEIENHFETVAYYNSEQFKIHGAKWIKSQILDKLNT